MVITWKIHFFITQVCLKCHVFELKNCGVFVYLCMRKNFNELALTWTNSGEIEILSHTLVNHALPLHWNNTNELEWIRMRRIYVQWHVSWSQVLSEPFWHYKIQRNHDYNINFSSWSTKSWAMHKPFYRFLLNCTP